MDRPNASRIGSFNIRNMIRDVEETGQYHCIIVQDVPRRYVLATLTQDLHTGITMRHIDINILFILSRGRVSFINT